MQECWNDEPMRRPKFEDLAFFFQEMLAEDSKVIV